MTIVLVAFDDMGIRDRLAYYLIEKRYKVIKANSYDEACQELEGPRDVILLSDDWMEKKMQGLELCKLIQQKGLATKVVTLSDSPEVWQDAGADVIIQSEQLGGFQTILNSIKELT